jgi:hypothetical protein
MRRRSRSSIMTSPPDVPRSRHSSTVRISAFSFRSWNWGAELNFLFFRRSSQTGPLQLLLGNAWSYILRSYVSANRELLLSLCQHVT